MKISNSKKELARIISENGGWRDGSEFAAQDGDGTGSIDFFKSKPRYDKDDKYWKGEYDLNERINRSDVTIKNFHQTILSRDEYFRLYPAPDAKPEYCEPVMRSIPEPGAKNTIEQLASDYRNAKDYAERKLQEADDAKADAEARLKALELASEAIGLIVSPITAKQESELVITDWRDWIIGDLVMLINRQGGNASVGEVGKISKAIGNGDFYVDFPSQSRYSVEHSDIKFIRRP